MGLEGIGGPFGQLPQATESRVGRFAAGRVTRFRGDSLELSSVLTDLMKKYHGELNMSQTLEEAIRVSVKRVIADIPVSQFVDEMPQEKLLETQALIAQRLAESK